MSPAESLSSSTLSIAECLQAQASAVERTGPGRWQFRVNGLSESMGTAQMDREWLCLSMRLDGDRAVRRLSTRHLAHMLVENGELPGGVKFSLAGPSAKATLSAEIPLGGDDEADRASLEAWIAEACAGLRQGTLQWSILRAGASDLPLAEPLEERGEADEEAEKYLAEVCRRAGWSFTTRASGHVAVRLDVRDAFCQAVLAQRVGKMARLRASLSSPALEQRVSAEAINLLMLSASGLVRLARATACCSGDRWEYGWEAVLPPDYLARELSHALSALSIACQLTVRELQVLEETTIAREYVEVRGYR